MLGKVRGISLEFSVGSGILLGRVRFRLGRVRGKKGNLGKVRGIVARISVGSGGQSCRPRQGPGDKALSDMSIRDGKFGLGAVTLGWAPVRVGMRAITKQLVSRGR
jgi:hypothetical protein